MTNRAKGWLIATIFSAGIWAVACFIALDATASLAGTLSADSRTHPATRPVIATEPA